ncbi:unnamed protein product [Diamesa tonsa]
MSAKKPPIEERMALSIYNSLQVLMKGHKTTVEFQKILTKTMFIKANTPAFIHVSHFLFTLFDAKEFKRRFYWPIHDKSAENSYRTTSVEYINDLIEKHSLKTDKIKAVNVVHPGGLKFQNLLHIIIQLVIKKELSRFTNKSPKSLDLHEVKLQYSSRKTLEKSLMQTVTSNIEVIKSKTLAITQLIDNILNSDEQKEKDFISKWNNFNKKRLKDIKLRNIKIVNVKMELSAMCHNAEKLLTAKKRQITSQYNENIKELLDLFQNQFLKNSLIVNCDLEINDRVNYQCLVQLLHAMIPFINNYISNFSYGGAETIPYEKRVISKFCNEMNELSTEISVFSRRYEMDSVVSMKNTSRSLSNEAENQIKPYIVNTPNFKFDFSEMCINLGNVNGPRLALLAEEQENPLNPVRKRRDPLAILEKATQSKPVQKKRNDYSSNYQLSSTMLSPAEGRLNRENPNFSRISSISSISKISPVIPDDYLFRNNYDTQSNNRFLSTIMQQQHQNTSPLASKNHAFPEVFSDSTPSPLSMKYKRKSSINSVNLLQQCSIDNTQMQMSPTGKLESLQFDDLSTSVSENQDVTILVNSDYIDDDVNTETIIPLITASPKNDDEMLFNVSDTLLSELNFDSP